MTSGSTSGLIPRSPGFYSWSGVCQPTELLKTADTQHGPAFSNIDLSTASRSGRGEGRQGWSPPASNRCNDGVRNYIVIDYQLLGALRTMARWRCLRVVPGTGSSRAVWRYSAETVRRSGLSTRPGAGPDTADTTRTPYNRL